MVKVADLSGRLGITMQNVFKIVHILSRAELLSAMRGRHGGVRLTRPADKIRVSDIVRAMETTEFGLEGDAGTVDEAVSRGVNKVLDSALEAFLAILDQHTLADLAAEKTRLKASAKSRGTVGTRAAQPALAALRPAKRRPAKPVA